MADLKVTQVKSTIGTKPKTRGTMRALGLRRIGMSNTLPDRPEIRGMIARVPHLIRVEEATDETVPPRSDRLGRPSEQEATPAEPAATEFAEEALLPSATSERSEEE